jgi:hypothetical protein
MAVSIRPRAPRSGLHLTPLAAGILPVLHLVPGPAMIAQVIVCPRSPQSTASDREQHQGAP